MTVISTSYKLVKQSSGNDRIQPAAKQSFGGDFRLPRRSVSYFRYAVHFFLSELAGSICAHVAVDVKRLKG
ncbi:hypothetical protein [Mesorhizobium sp. WSM4311]|uniref:hypothetical protein n=1 Tax=Mesorhizobium sp. WSM4311 TaxID=2029410 RepID=UPI0015CE833E|nr:hypothetical protein [Mesorhizobium sp. WSM4311]